jgi:2-polyprenyl-3-methyl-5-hydroxy-6-metoxy-1,4-benzoquinol methylase
MAAPEPSMAERVSSRSTSFGQDGSASPVDRFGVWLSKRQITKVVGSLAGKDVGDFGCGFEATFARTVLAEVGSAVLVDVALAPDLGTHPKVTAIEGLMPDALKNLADQSLDVVLCMSVVEHLWDPAPTLAEFHRLLRPGGVCAVNVPSWLGKRALEFSAFKLGLSPACEMDDHKAYYDPRDLWPLMVRAGFRPHAIKCFRHKFGLNTFAVCTVDPTDNV